MYNKNANLFRSMQYLFSRRMNVHILCKFVRQLANFRELFQGRECERKLLANFSKFFAILFCELAK